MSLAGKTYTKLNPLKYPTKKVKRAQDPPVYASYSRYRPYIEKEFGYRCIYCCRSDQGQASSSFHIEHYRPKESFKELETDYNNLFYACGTCNRAKWTYWSDDPKERVLNPCDDVMSTHLQFDKAVVKHTSALGKFLIELCHINENKSLKFRESELDILWTLTELLLQLRNDGLKKNKHKIDKAVAMLAKMLRKDEPAIRTLCKV